MVNKTPLAALAIISLILPFTLKAQITLDFFSDPGVTTSGVYSNNTPWPTDGGFKFQIGSFGSFTPTSSNTNNWLTNWTPISGVLNPTDWIDDGGDFYYFGLASYTVNTAPFSIGTMIYVWGFNSQAYAPGSEWILFGNNTDPDWSFRDVTTGPLSLNLDSSNDAGMLTILGSGGGGSTFQSAAVPEPGTVTLFGLAAMGYLWFVRRRRVA